MRYGFTVQRQQFLVNKLINIKKGFISVSLEISKSNGHMLSHVGRVMTPGMINAYHSRCF